LLEPDPLHGISPLVVSLFLGRARLVLRSIVNAAADGKRLRAIDALRRSGIIRPNGRKTA
jgi:hypothetical protein